MDLTNRLKYTLPISKCNLRDPDEYEKEYVKKAILHNISLYTIIVHKVLRYLWPFIIIGLITICILVFINSIKIKSICLLIAFLNVFKRLDNIYNWLSKLNAYRKALKGNYKLTSGIIDGKDNNNNTKDKALKHISYFYISTEDNKHAVAIGDNRWDKFNINDSVYVLVIGNINFIIKK